MQATFGWILINVLGERFALRYTWSPVVQYVLSAIVNMMWGFWAYRHFRGKRFF